MSLHQVSTTAPLGGLALLFSVFTPAFISRAGALASKVNRKDTLALKLGSRSCVPDRDRFVQDGSSRDEQPHGQGLTWQSREQWEAIRTQIGTALSR